MPRFALAALLLACLTLPVQAAAFLPRTGDTVTIGPQERIQDDLYVSASTITIEGTIDGDLVAAGSTVTVSGTVTGDVLVMGGTVSISGTVGGTVRVGAGTLVVSGPIGKDLVAGAGTLTIGDGATIGRDAAIGAGTATLAGRLQRNLYAGTGELQITGSVGGDVVASVERLTISSSGSVAGSVRYTSEQEANVEQGARVGGPVQRLEPAERPGGQAGWKVLRWLRGLVAFFLLGLLWLLPFRRHTVRTVDALRTRPWHSLGVGAAVFFGTPLVALLLVFLGALVGGWWIGLLVLLVWLVVVLLGIPAAALFAGRWVLERAGKAQTALALRLVVGLILLWIVRVVPVLGALVLFAAMLFGLGALIVATARHYRAGSVEPAALGPTTPEPRSEQRSP